MHTPAVEREQELAILQQQFKEGSDKIIEKICSIIRNHPPGYPLRLTFARQFTTVIAQFLTAKALEITEADGIQVYGLIVDFEPD